MHEQEMREENRALYDRLTADLRSLGRVAVAFSSGVDSTLLLKAAVDALGNNVLAVTARSRSFPERENLEAA
ncbi:MAG: TIGR00268 family protein, partial [Lachnospiraceae bacterium]|nr:TIGR00268 family protein [Lachnospiraceae bacterium]